MSTMTMRYAAAATAAIAATLWYKHSNQSKPKKQSIQGTVHYIAVRDEYELQITGDGPTQINNVTHTGLECMSNAGYKVRTYTQTDVGLISAANSPDSFTKDCARCRVRSRIQYTVANHKQATTTIHWDKIVCPDEFAHQAYTDLMQLTH